MIYTKTVCRVFSAQWPGKGERSRPCPTWLNNASRYVRQGDPGVAYREQRAGVSAAREIRWTVPGRALTSLGAMRQEDVWDDEAARQYDTPGMDMFAPEVLGPTVVLRDIQR